jgi:biotin carboxyl carrier protein
LPGLIVEVGVKPGQQIAANDVVVVLEAMKMENELTAARAGTVTEVRVEAGQTVNQGDVLVVLE